MTSALSRRGFLGGAAATGLGIALAGSIEAIAGTAAHAAARSATGYGPLVTDPEGLLSLPEGFSYKVVAEAGVARLDGGGVTPSDADGTGAFANGRGTTLVNNHEIGGSEPYRVPVREGLTYDPGAGGGTTNIEVSKQGDRIREYVSVAGTHNNCAGGITPWGTWLTCEETEQRKGGVFTQDHGYVFEVSPIESENADKSPVPLKFLGRFSHEAVCVDPATGTIYETEDASGPLGLYFRWTPPEDFRKTKGQLHELALATNDDPNSPAAGTLEAMRCFDHGTFVPDLSLATEPGTRYTVEWVPVPDRDAKTVSVRKQFNYVATDSKGNVTEKTDGADVTRSRKLEGQWWADGGAYFVASFARSESAKSHDGQVWFYDPKASTVTLMTIFAYTPADQDNDPDGPDNITVSPYGGVILAEDGEGASHLVGVTADGSPYFLARNEDEDSNEFTGPTFSADGKLLFANVQDPGRVFAIRGPWKASR